MKAKNTNVVDMTHLPIFLRGANLSKTQTNCCCPHKKNTSFPNIRHWNTAEHIIETAKIKYLFFRTLRVQERGIDRTIRVIRSACYQSRNCLKIASIPIKIYITLYLIGKIQKQNHFPSYLQRLKFSTHQVQKWQNCWQGRLMQKQLSYTNVNQGQIKDYESSISKDCYKKRTVFSSNPQFSTTFFTLFLIRQVWFFSTLRLLTVRITIQKVTSIITSLFVQFDQKSSIILLNSFQCSLMSLSTWQREFTIISYRILKLKMQNYRTTNFYNPCSIKLTVCLIYCQFLFYNINDASFIVWDASLQLFKDKVWLYIVPSMFAFEKVARQVGRHRNNECKHRIPKKVSSKQLEFRMTIIKNFLILPNCQNPAKSNFLMIKKQHLKVQTTTFLLGSVCIWLNSTFIIKYLGLVTRVQIKLLQLLQMMSKMTDIEFYLIEFLVDWTASAKIRSRNREELERVWMRKLLLAREMVPSWLQLGLETVKQLLKISKTQSSYKLYAYFSFIMNYFTRYSRKSLYDPIII